MGQSAERELCYLEPWLTASQSLSGLSVVSAGNASDGAAEYPADLMCRYLLRSAEVATGTS